MTFDCTKYFQDLKKHFEKKSKPRADRSKEELSKLLEEHRADSLEKQGRIEIPIDFSFLELQELLSRLEYAREESGGTSLLFSCMGKIEEALLKWKLKD